MNKELTIQVCDLCGNTEGLYLEPDQWNDWFRFRTAFHFYYVDSSGKRTDIGWVKIGKAGLDSSRHIREELPNEPFTKLDDTFYSLGQDAEYYERINTIFDDAQRERILSGLRDMAFDTRVYERFASEKCVQDSILRSVSPATLKGEFSRLAHGKARLTAYDFSISLSGASGYESLLHISVTPASTPPTNICAIIGNNGAGKTSLLKGILSAFGEKETEESPYHVCFRTEDGVRDCREFFSSVVCVGFSAFDNLCSFGMRVRGSVEKGSIIHPVGLDMNNARNERSEEGRVNDEGQSDSNLLKTLFSGCVEEIRGNSTRRRMWKNALEQLLGESSVDEMVHSVIGDRGELDQGDSLGVLSCIEKRFPVLSSGHKIVLLTAGELIRYVEEKTLVLIDEPEMHLHPPLLSAFIQALSSILIDRNGIAIIATHSPVVLQEVPSSCAWILSRSGSDCVVSPLSVETYGTDINSLMREAFGFEINHTGFHSTIKRILRDNNYDIEKTEAAFGGRLGNDARAFLRVLSMGHGDENA